MKERKMRAKSKRKNTRKVQPNIGMQKGVLAMFISVFAIMSTVLIRDLRKQEVRVTRSLRGKPKLRSLRSATSNSPGDVAGDASPAENSGRAHIVQVAGDEKYTKASATAINSILKSSSTPELVTIHIFVETTKTKDNKNQENVELCQQKYEFVKNFGARLEIHEYTYEDVKLFINKRNTPNEGKVKIPGNYVRFLLPEHLPHVERCLWIDSEYSDMVVKKDIFPLLNVYGRKKAISAISRNMDYITSYARKKLKKNGIAVSKPLPSFDADIMVINLKYWRDHDIIDQILKICDLNEDYNLYPRYGSQPPLQILFSGDQFERINRNVMVNDLGWNDSAEKQSEIQRNSTMFLHWDGPRKPWLNNGLFKEEWEKYRVQSDVKMVG